MQVMRSECYLKKLVFWCIWMQMKCDSFVAFFETLMIWRISWKMNVVVAVAPASSMQKVVAGAVKDGTVLVCAFPKRQVARPMKKTLRTAQAHQR